MWAVAFGFPYQVLYIVVQEKVLHIHQTMSSLVNDVCSFDTNVCIECIIIKAAASISITIVHNPPSIVSEKTS